MYSRAILFRGVGTFLSIETVTAFHRAPILTACQHNFVTRDWLATSRKFRGKYRQPASLLICFPRHIHAHHLASGVAAIDSPVGERGRGPAFAAEHLRARHRFEGLG